MHVERGSEIILLSFACEVAKLCEIAVNHNDFAGCLMFTVGHEDTAIVFVSIVEFAIKPDACSLAVTYFSVGVEDEQEVARDGRAVH